MGELAEAARCRHPELLGMLPDHGIKTTDCSSVSDRVRLSSTWATASARQRLCSVAAGALPLAVHPCRICGGTFQPVARAHLQSSHTGRGSPQSGSPCETDSSLRYGSSEL